MTVARAMRDEEPVSAVDEDRGLARLARQRLTFL
jgi:hypothetical protein